MLYGDVQVQQNNIKQSTKANKIKLGLMNTTKLIRFNYWSLSLDDINSDVMTLFIKHFVPS